jgi:hypothetical protein
MQNLFMKNTIRTSFIVCLVVVASVACFPQYSFAYTKTKVPVSDQNDFVVEPGKTEVFLDSGESMVKSISVTNRINKKITFKLTTEDFIGSNDSNQPVVLLGDSSSPYSLKDFIIPEIKEFSLDFGEKITIPVTISIPLNAEPRGYYGALIVSNDPDVLGGENGLEAEGKTRIVSRIGSLFLLKINGEGSQSGTLDDFKVIGPKKLLHSKRPSGFEIAFKNTGNVHLVPYGTITLKNILGQVVGTLPVDAYFVLPESTRYREIVWSDGMSMGRYTAHLSLYRGYDNEYEESTISFWVIPWKVLIPVFVAIFLVVTCAYYLLTRFELRKK